MNKFGLKFLSLLFLISFLLPTRVSNAQSTSNTGPVYIVQEGDSLWDIAYIFHVSQHDLALANGITDINQIKVGESLVIPGLDGIEGILSIEHVAFGETLRSLSLRYRIPLSLLERLNHLTSPNELFVGSSLVILKDSNRGSLGRRAILGSGQTLLEFAIRNDTDPWTVMRENQVASSTEILPEDILRIAGQEDTGPGDLPPGISSMEISGLSQGSTAEIRMASSEELSISGLLMGHPLNFFIDPGRGYVALQGVHAMVEPGLYAISITLKQPNGSHYEFAQSVVVSAQDFPLDYPLQVDPATLDPETTVPEDKQWMDLAAQVSPNKLWEGIFALPVDPVFAGCYPSRFGNRRSYNGSDYKYFHTGLDFCSQIGNPIYAAASGVVVFTGDLTVRGKATMIDHGNGVFTAYMHQSEILVNVGDPVEQGELIGKVGNTGRVEGPHLHFEVIVGGVQVNPLDWLDQAYP